MNIKSYEQAKILGMGEVWLEHMRGQGEPKPSPSVIVPPAKSQAPDDGLNKLERAFWKRLQDAKAGGIFKEAWREPFKLRVVNNRYYIPDFATHAAFGNPLTCWETKGWMREDAELKLLAAAERYQCFNWVLVQKDRGRWRCIEVTPRGFSKDEFTPDWLR